MATITKSSHGEVVEVGSLDEALAFLEQTYFESNPPGSGASEAIARRLWTELRISGGTLSEMPEGGESPIQELMAVRDRFNKMPNVSAIYKALDALHENLLILGYPRTEFFYRAEKRFLRQNAEKKGPRYRIFCVAGELRELRVVGPRKRNREDTNPRHGLLLRDTPFEDPLFFHECAFDAAAVRPSAAMKTAVRPSLNQVPSACSDFIGRRRELAAVRKELQLRRRIVGFFGLGGSGRRQLAFRIAEFYRSNYSGFQLLFEFGSAEAAAAPSAASPIRLYRHIIETLTPEEAESLRDAPVDHLARAAAAALRAARGMLVLLNVPHFLFDLFQPPRNVLTIFTCSRKVTEQGVNAILATAFGRWEARRLLRAAAGISYPGPQPLDPKVVEGLGDEHFVAELKAIRRADGWDALALLCARHPKLLQYAGQSLAEYEGRTISEVTADLAANECGRLSKLREFKYAGVIGPYLRTIYDSLPIRGQQLWCRFAVVHSPFTPQELRSVWPDVAEALPLLEQHAVVVFDSATRMYSVSAIARLYGHERLHDEMAASSVSHEIVRWAKDDLLRKMEQGSASYQCALYQKCVDSQAMAQLFNEYYRKRVFDWDDFHRLWKVFDIREPRSTLHGDDVELGLRAISAAGKWKLHEQMAMTLVVLGDVYEKRRKDHLNAMRCYAEAIDHSHCLAPADVRRPAVEHLLNVYKATETIDDKDLQSEAATIMARVTELLTLMRDPLCNRVQDSVRLGERLTRE